MRQYLTFLLITMSMAIYAIDKPKSSEVGFARHFAEDYLMEKSSNIKQLNLTLEEYTDRLFFFNDMQNHVFILMARDNYANLLNDQVLAFSIGVPHSKARDTETFMHLYDYYDKLIQDMSDGKVPQEQKAEQTKLRIQPMLYTIRWRQFQMKDVFEGQAEPVLSGCGAVAVGQLMKYYEWPKVMTGSFCYKDTKQNLRKISMDGTPIEWGNIKNIYRYNDTQSKSLEPLMKSIGLAISSDFGKDNTGSSARYLERAMVMNFGYSPAMFLAISKDLDESTVINLIKADLKTSRPCILIGGNHLFVCDGAYDDFLHLNMGWGGSYDGWYRFPVVKKGANTKPFIISALLNITPHDSLGLSKAVTVENPGTLQSLLTEDECTNMMTLKVSGKINGTDISLLRRMAGCVDSTNCFSWKGRLTSLDLSDATIVKDTVPYFIIDAKKIGYNTSYKGTLYHFSKMTDEDWKTFCSNGCNDIPTYTITRQDTSYYISTKTLENIIGMYMFERCENLQHITLPKDITNISLRAFSGCHCLKNITIPSAVRDFPPSCFADCISLESIKVCSDSPLLKMQDAVNSGANRRGTFFNCNPNLRIETDDSLESFAVATTRLLDKHHKSHVAKSDTNASNTVTTTKSKKSNVLSVPMGAKIVSHYKMVNGKKVLIGKEVVK